MSRYRGEARGGRVAVIDTTTDEVIASVNVGGRAGSYTAQQLQETAEFFGKLRDAAIAKVNSNPEVQPHG